MNFGQLSLWVRLSCDIEKVEAFKKRRGIVDVEKPKKELEPKIVPKEEIVMEPKKVTTSEEEPEVFHYESSTEIDNNKICFIIIYMFYYERWNNPVILKSDPLSLDDSDEVQSVVLEKVPTLEEELTVMKETDEENKNSIKDPMMVNDVPLKWRTESNEETTEEEEFNERLVIRWLREKKIKFNNATFE